MIVTPLVLYQIKCQALPHSPFDCDTSSAIYTLSKFFLEHKQAHGAEYVCIFLSVKFYYLNPKGMLKPSL